MDSKEGKLPPMRNAKYVLEETMTKLLEWVCPAEINPLQDLNTYKELITENTALWIFDHEMYKTWIESSPSFLWLSGESLLPFQLQS